MNAHVTIRQIPKSTLFFWAAFFFLIGTLIASTTIYFHTISIRIVCLALITTLALTGLYFLKKPYAPLALLIFIGGIYCIAYYRNQQSEKIPIGRPVRIEGVITHREQHATYQKLRLDNNLIINADRYPLFAYGDRITLQGTVRASRSPLIRGYVHARYVDITRITSNEGNPLKKHLYALRHAFEDTIKKVLPSEKAAFLIGLTVGSTAEFTKGFMEDLRTTGTTHLVALSGSNISYIISVIMLTLAWFLPRKQLFWPTLSIITLFVIMTGAEASLVRAALMNSIVLFGAHYERTSNTRNAIITAALIMTLWNPLTPAFDLGFQLSFAAILGMTYIQPFITRYSPWKNTDVMTALSAQVAVMPILAITTGNAHPLSIIPNILIASAIPITVGLGFLTGILGFISTTLSFAPAWIANVLLSYEMGVVHIFARYM